MGGVIYCYFLPEFINIGCRGFLFVVLKGGVYFMGIKCVPDEKQYVNKLNPSDLYEYTLKQIQCYGFEYFCFCFTTHLKNIHVSVKRVSNYSDEFIEFYRSIDVSLNNPLVSHCQRSIDPIIWDESIFRDTPELSRQAQAHGLNYGWSQAVHDTQGWTSILNMARSSTAITQEEFDEKAADVLWLCNQLHGGVLAELSPAQRVQTPLEHLSQREAEVLKWTAQGKTASDVGMILGLTTRTVNFHISSAIRKLGTSNKTSAVVLATQRGFI